MKRFNNKCVSYSNMICVISFNPIKVLHSITQYVFNIAAVLVKKFPTNELP